MLKNTVDLIGFLGKNAEGKFASDSTMNFTVSASPRRRTGGIARPANGNGAPNGTMSLLYGIETPPQVFYEGSSGTHSLITPGTARGGEGRIHHAWVGVGNGVALV